MDLECMFSLVIICLAAFYVIASLLSVVGSSSKLPLHVATTSWGAPRFIVCLCQIGLLSAVVVDAVQKVHGESSSAEDRTYQHAVTISIAAGSITSLTLATLRPQNFLQVVYAVLSCLIWTLTSILVTRYRGRSAILASLYFCTLIATLSVPYESPIEYAQVHPLTSTPALPALTLSWLDPIIKKAARGSLTIDSLWPISEDISIQEHASKEAQRMRTQTWNDKTSLSWIMSRNFGWLLSFSAVLGCVNLIATFVQPFLLRSLLQDQEPLAVLGLFIASTTSGSCEAHMMYRMQIVGMKLRSLLTALICDRELVATDVGNTESPEAAVLIEVDLPRVFDLIEQAQLLWLIPLQVLISLGALIYILGWKSVCIGCLSPMILLPILSYVTGHISFLVGRVMEAKDARIALISQVLKQVRQIKLASLESLFERLIDESRDYEVKQTRNVAVSNAGMVCIVYLLPTTLIFASFSSYSYLTGQLTSDVVFPALALFFSINRATALLPRMVMLYKQGMISFDRVRNTLAYTLSDKLTPKEPSDGRERQPRVVMQHASVGIPGLPEPILRGCSIDLAPGTLTVISGRVGSGKTTFLRSILGDATSHAGSIHVQGRIAYASQKPFLISGSVRENITFGAIFDGPFYERVLKAVALDHDLMRLPDRDNTMLGGTAVALSGGQMSRIALARAVYSRRELVVLDDPLAAIDGQVRRHIIDNVLGPNGILKESVRIVTTSAAALIATADQVYVIANGTINRESATIMGAKSSSSSGDSESPPRNQMPKKERKASGVVKFGRNYGSLKSAGACQVVAVPAETESEIAPLLINKVDDQVTDATATQQSNTSTYLRFLALSKTGGWPIVLALASVSKLLDVIGLYFLKVSSEEVEATGHSNKLIFYIICGLAGAWLSAIFVLAAYFLCLLPASRRIHGELTKGVLESKFSFFDGTPLGQILSRFTNDINKIDGQVGAGLIGIVVLSVTALSSVLVILSTSLLSAVYLIPISVVYFAIQSHYLHACKQLRRLENEARGPVLNVADEIKVGAPVIRCYDQTPEFKIRTRKAIDDHVRVWGPFLSLNIWVMLRLQVLSGIIQLLSAILLLAIRASPSTLGLVMNFIIQITGQFNNLVRIRANLEADITSTERVFEYAANPSENTNDEVIPPSSWPQMPSVVFDSFTASYVPGGPLCSNSLSFVIEPGQHVAVVGRTGAGKSSLAMALLRTLDQDAIRNGQIRVDGIDISRIKLSTLRRRITIVPQEPMIFQGTLRFNLDPEGIRTDTELLKTCELCDIQRLVNLDGRGDILDIPIATKHTSLSVGQAQIIALARATLARNKIIVLDEVVASMDAKSRNTIHDLIKRRFWDCTVLSITHNLDRIMQYDKVLVLDSGRVIDYDEPAILLQKHGSVLAELAREASKDGQNNVQL